MEFALFVTGGLWGLAAKTAANHSAAGLALRFRLEIFQPLLEAAFLLFLLLTGFTAIHWVATRRASLRHVNALPTRATRGREWSLGAALGWAMLVAAVLPMFLAGDLLPTFWFQPRGWGLTLLSLLTLALLSLALEVAFRGYLYIRLTRAVGVSAATFFMACLYASAAAFHAQSSRTSLVVAFLLGLLLAVAYQRTQALWLGWGLHFAWMATMGVVFGLPVGGSDAFSAMVDTNIQGANWLTGGLYGPEGAVLTVAVVLAAFPLLYSLTRDFAWQYTYRPIVAAGYAMDVTPPAEHTAMEAAAAARPAPLVQIAAVTSSAASTLPVIEKHLSEGAEHPSE